MRVLLINPSVSVFSIYAKAPTCPLGLLSIASYIEANGHTVKIVDKTVGTENVKKCIKIFNPDIVGITVISPVASKGAVKVSKIAKKFNKPVVWGGPFVSVVPELALKEGCVDFVVIGEGEITFSELLDSILNSGSLDDIDGLAFIDKDGVHINKDRDFADLSKFPNTDWSLIDPEKYFQHFWLTKKMLYLYFSKGCPGKCTFCYNPKYHRSLHRTRPPEHVIDEIEYLVNNFGMDGVNFADDFLYPGKEELQTFIRLIKEKKLDFKWGGQTRLGVYSREELQQMYDAGCRWLLFGVEGASKERIKSIKKGISLDVAKETYEICKEIGITSQSAFIIGYPDETEEELKETIRFAFYLDAELCMFSLLYLDPGAELFEDSVNNGLYVPPESLREWSKTTVSEDLPVNLSKVPDRELKVIHYYFQWLGFSKKDGIRNDYYGVAKKMIADAIIKTFKPGGLTFFPSIYSSLKRFLIVVWYAKAYPKILKKYGLHKHR